MHEHGSATRPRITGLAATAPPAGVDERGESFGPGERDEFGEHDELGGVADVR
ncbi:hypothetical protein ACGFY7_30165 [Streptomyces prunicolor]|uniref:hypothetical protein n=1 Tax=Streptomyces prunicolor TaxID=67348 RepID=UPI00370F8431